MSVSHHDQLQDHEARLDVLANAAANANAIGSYEKGHYKSDYPVFEENNVLEALTDHLVMLL